MPIKTDEKSPIVFFQGDCREVLRKLEENSIDSVVTDPPYDLKFMGKEWDATGIAFQPEMWQEVLRVLKPGGHLIAMGGTRTHHRLWCAVEDAGFEIRDTLMWLYGQGFPKSLDVSKAIDKAGGASALHTKARQSMAQNIRYKREQAGLSRKQLASMFPQYGYVTENWERLDAGFRIPSLDAYEKLVRKIGVNPQWRKQVRSEDLRLKQVGVKKDRRGDNTIYSLAHSGNKYEASTNIAHQWEGWGTALKPAWEPILLARKPLSGTVAATVQEHGTGALNIDGCRIGEGKGGVRGGEASAQRRYTEKGSTNFAVKPGPRGGGAAGRWPANVLLDEEAAALLDAQTGTLKSGKDCTRRKEGYWGAGDSKHGGLGKAGDEQGTYGDAGGASRFFYCAKASRKERGEGNNHPTVKPLALMRWLVRLITPPGGKVLDPFIGSGTTALAAKEEGFRCIGIDIGDEYLKIAKRRCGVVDNKEGKS